LLETLHETAISFPVFEQAVEVEALERASKAHQRVALTNGNGRHPGRNWPVLTAWQPELGMTKRLKEKLSVSSRVE